MASINITIPDAIAPRVIDAVAVRYNWTPESGRTKAQFAKDVIVRWLKETVKMHEAQIASSAAQETSNQQVDTDITIS